MTRLNIKGEAVSTRVELYHFIQGAALARLLLGIAYGLAGQ
jgi:hypothetical protein